MHQLFESVALKPCQLHGDIRSGNISSDKNGTLSLVFCIMLKLKISSGQEANKRMYSELISSSTAEGGKAFKALMEEEEFFWNVMLLSQNLKKNVAKDYIGTQTMCHLREIVPVVEKVVCITKVLDAETLIYDGPQNGHYKLCEFSDGGYGSRFAFAVSKILYIFS